MMTIGSEENMLYFHWFFFSASTFVLQYLHDSYAVFNSIYIYIIQLYFHIFTTTQCHSHTCSPGVVFSLSYCYDLSCYVFTINK